MITRKIVGIAILVVFVLLPATVLIISLLIDAIKDAIKDVIKYGDTSLLFILFWATVALVGLGLVIFC